MKRFVNYKAENGNVYEICGDVEMLGGNSLLHINFNTLGKIDMLNFVTKHEEVTYAEIGEKRYIELPFYNVTYISHTYEDSCNETIILSKD